MLPSLPAPQGNGASSEEENSLLLSPEVLQDGPEGGKSKLQN